MAPDDQSSRDRGKAVVLFDGVCNFCNASVRFVIERDPHAYFQFAPLSSPHGRALLAAAGLPAPTVDPDAMVLFENDQVYVASTAALRIAKRLTFPWPLLFVFIIVPRPLRDLVYGWFARHRYQWFGRSDTCPIPTSDVAARFLDAG